MVLLRTYDERSVVYHRQGRIGTYAIFWNHEAIQAGATFALARRRLDLPVATASRRSGSCAACRPTTILQWWRGHPSGWWNPADWNVASICVPIATHVPHAAGLAWGKKLRGEDAVAMAFFGDGATSEGAFHEGANFAAVMDAPLVFVCNNNQWAISTPLEAQTRAETLADKAVGYGIPGVRVDGLDVLAVYEAAREAVERARAGGGPTFDRGGHYRAAPHATADDPRAYIDLERVEEERARECVGQLRGASCGGSACSTTSCVATVRDRGARPHARRDRGRREPSAGRPRARLRSCSFRHGLARRLRPGDTHDRHGMAELTARRGGQRRAARRARARRAT